MGYDERLRLLYVACTRACDHLVVSLHREQRRNPPKEKRNRTNAEVLVAGMGERLAELPDLSGDPTPLRADPAAVPAPPPDFEQWEAERSAALAAAPRPGAVAATALTDEGGPDRGTDPGDLVAGPRRCSAAPRARRGRPIRGCRSDPATSTCRRG